MNEFTQKLFQAVLNKYTRPEKIKFLVKKGADVNAVNEDGITVLMSALDNICSNSVIEELLKSGADAKAKTQDGTTALLIAAINNPNPLIIRQLISVGADVNEIDRDGTSILMRAAETNRQPLVIQELINAGANVNAIDNDGRTALFFAAVNPVPDVARILILNGADTDIQDKFREWAISIAYENNNQETLEFLRWINNAFSKVDWETVSPEEIRRLIRDGANVNGKIYHYVSRYESYTNTPIEEAAALSHDKNVIEALITAGAYSLDNALITAASCDNYEAVAVLLVFGADADYYDINLNKTALMCAAENHSSVEIINILIEAGADVNAWGGDDDYDREIPLEMTPLMFAVSSDVYNYDLRVIETLISHGADVNAKDYYEGQTVLMLACLNYYPETVEILIKAGAKVNARDNHGRTALMRLIRREEEENDCDIGMINILIKYGADINIKDILGKTALDYAQEAGKNEVLEILEELR